MTTAVPSDLARLQSARKTPRTEHELSVDPVVGKDVLELLSSAMYVDPRSIYREYIQNAADSIDGAFAAGLFNEGQLARVDISLDLATRSVSIRDNGAGISNKKAESLLAAIGASTKRGTGARGFRGVGRLAAIGYAQMVTFRTKAAGEDVVTEVRWDCRKVKAGLGDHTYHGDLRRIVRDAIVVAEERGHALTDHFFEVRLDRIVRIKNDILLNPEEIEAYLGEVAPAPFAPGFDLGDQIDAKLKVTVRPSRFRMYLNGSPSFITRPHRTDFSVSEKKSDSTGELEWFELSDNDGGVRAIGWIAHHGYLGAIYSRSQLRGLRARVGDIQVGEQDLFAECFPEPRFNGWTIGEIHVLDPKLIPNGRRDGFEQNAAYIDLLSQIVPIARDISRRCRQTSARRAKVRGFEFRADRMKELLETLTQRGISKTHAGRMRAEIGRLLSDMRRLLESSALLPEDRHRLNRRLTGLRAHYAGVDKLVSADDPLSDIPPARRSAYQQVIELFLESAPNKAAAQKIVDQVLTKLAASALRARRRTGRSRKS